MSERFRCSVAAAAEPMPGTAAHDRAFLLVEHPAPWGRKALEESRWLPDEVRASLSGRAERAGVRVQLIRRHRAAAPASGFRVFLVHADPAAPWTATTVLEQPEDLLAIPLDDLAAGPPEGLEAHAQPLLLVCTNGRRDACCAELGRPLAAALDAAYPDHAWETTHLGGHRFAGAMLVLPSGLSYGRVGAEGGLRIAALALEGRLDLRHLRGRAAYPPAVQAAEIELLDRLGTDRDDALTLAGVEASGDETRVTFTARGGASHRVVVTAEAGEEVRQSCSDGKLKPATHYRVA